jgi:hypothetical protein
LRTIAEGMTLQAIVAVKRLAALAQRLIQRAEQYLRP